jgi:type IV pilus assembly protein PilO
MKLSLSPLVEKVEKIGVRARICIFAGTILLLGGLFVYFVYIPKSDEITRLEQQIENLERRVVIAKSRARNLDKLKAEMEVFEAQFKEALKLLPNEREIPNLLRTITQMGSDSNLEFHLFKPEKEVPETFYIAIPVSIEVAGDFLDVARFFDKVGGMERIVNILNVSMRPEKDFSTTLKTTCTAVTYRFKGEEEGDGKG